LKQRQNGCYVDHGKESQEAQSYHLHPRLIFELLLQLGEKWFAMQLTATNERLV
jgi:hypothetical protein